MELMDFLMIHIIAALYLTDPYYYTSQCQQRFVRDIKKRN